LSPYSRPRACNPARAVADGLLSRCWGSRDTSRLNRQPATWWSPRLLLFPLRSRLRPRLCSPPRHDSHTPDEDGAVRGPAELVGLGFAGTGLGLEVGCGQCCVGILKGGAVLVRLLTGLFLGYILYSHCLGGVPFSLLLAHKQIVHFVRLEKALRVGIGLDVLGRWLKAARLRCRYRLLGCCVPLCFI